MRRGFTLIEMVVVIGVVGILMTASVVVLGGAFRGKGRVEIADNVEQNGSFILDELRKLGLAGIGIGITCPSGVGSSITIVSFKDGGVTTLSCVDDDQIASESANGRVEMVGKGIRLSRCTTFVSCDTMPNFGVAAINFDFTLSLGTNDFGGGLVERNFRSRVVVRN